MWAGIPPHQERRAGRWFLRRRIRACLRCETPSRWHRPPARFRGTHAANRFGHVCVFAIQDVQNFERRLPVKPAGTRIAPLGLAGLEKSKSQFDYSGRRRRGRAVKENSGVRCAAEVIGRQQAPLRGPAPGKRRRAAAGRTWRIFSLARVGFTRLVSSTTKSLRSGSIHSDVPVKPVWPKLLGEKYSPEEEGGAGTSQPSARAESPIVVARGELLDGRAPEHAVVRVDAAVEHHLRECGDIARRREKSGMAGDAAHGPGIFVVAPRLAAGACGKKCRLPWARFATRRFFGGLNRESSICKGAKMLSGAFRPEDRR